MKILIVNTLDIEGGAARAAYRLHRALLEQGLTSQMLVQSKSSDDSTVFCSTSKLQKGLARIRPSLDGLRVRPYKNRSQTPFSAAWVPSGALIDQINLINPDIVHLHWISAGMMRIEDIRRIKAPVVWTLHDMWPFTGGCHYDENCGAFRKTCGNCKVLASSQERDLSRKVFLRKQKTFAQKQNITVVALSRWIKAEAKDSTLFSEHQVVNLPNPIDTKIFAPFDRVQARKLLNLPIDKKLILFGAMGATSDPRKGFHELGEALQRLQTTDTELVVFGASQPDKGITFSQKAHYLGRLHDDVTLRVLYSAADVMLVPSRQEAFGQTASEALACGTPVVAFATTGLLDIVEHKMNGYLAKPFDIDDLANGVDWILEFAGSDSLAEYGRQKITQNFDFKVVAPKYIELYQSILRKENS